MLPRCRAASEQERSAHQQPVERIRARSLALAELGRLAGMHDERELPGAYGLPPASPPGDRTAAQGSQPVGYGRADRPVCPSITLRIAAHMTLIVLKGRVRYRGRRRLPAERWWGWRLEHLALEGVGGAQDGGLVAVPSDQHHADRQARGHRAGH